MDRWDDTHPWLVRPSRVEGWVAVVFVAARLPFLLVLGLWGYLDRTLFTPIREGRI